MKHLEDMVKDLDDEEKTALVGILNKSLVSEELTKLEEHLNSTQNVVERIAIKDRMCKLQNRK